MTYIPVTEKNPTEVRVESQGFAAFTHRAFVTTVEGDLVIAEVWGDSYDEARERAEVVAKAINTAETETYVKWLHSLGRSK